MRIISGIWGGRRINPPSSMPYTRPTTDIAREGLFNILQNNLDFSTLHTLDLFGGTGAISFELASRGVPEATIVEKDPSMYAFIKKTAADLGASHLNIVKSDVFSFIHNCREQYDLVFAGPPYALGNIDELPTLIFQNRMLKPKGWFILEHTPRNDYRKFPHYRTERNYGTTVFSIFVNEENKD